MKLEDQCNVLQEQLRDSTERATIRDLEHREAITAAKTAHAAITSTMEVMKTNHAQTKRDHEIRISELHKEIQVMYGKDRC